MGRKKKSLIEKSPFKLRHRKLADGRLSLFLDRSVDGGHEYEFLNSGLREIGSPLKHLPKQGGKMRRHSARRKIFSENGQKPCSMRRWEQYRKANLPICCCPTG